MLAKVCLYQFKASILQSEQSVFKKKNKNTKPRNPKQNQNKQTKKPNQQNLNKQTKKQHTKP